MTNEEFQLEDLAINSSYKEAEQRLFQSQQTHNDNLHGCVEDMWKHAKGYFKDFRGGTELDRSAVYGISRPHIMKTETLGEVAYLQFASILPKIIVNSRYFKEKIGEELNSLIYYKTPKQKRIMKNRIKKAMSYFSEKEVKFPQLIPPTKNYPYFRLK